MDGRYRGNDKWERLFFWKNYEKFTFFSSRPLNISIPSFQIIYITPTSGMARIRETPMKLLFAVIAAS
jgi:hypothetical protein